MCLLRREKLARPAFEKRERMRAVTRFGSLLLAGALAAAPATALAQQAPPPATAPSDAVGPRDLQNFSLSGTVTRPSDQPAAVQPAPAKRQPRAEAQSAPPQTPPRAAATAAPRRIESASAGSPLPRKSAPAPAPQPDPAPSIPVALPPATGGASAAPTAVPAAVPTFAPAPQPPARLAGHGFGMLAWLLEALALALAGAFLFWRSRGRFMFAGSAHFDLFTAPEAAPAPEPAPAPPPAAPPRQAAAPRPAAPAAAGVVSSRLRPWVEIGFHPVRCVLDDQRVVVEFDLELFNSGSAPARAVLAEATLFNAGPAQDSQIGAFFANPVGKGDRIAVIPPLKRLAIRTQAVAPRDQVLAYELAGRPVFVPLIAFNALYSWSGGEGQTSVSYLIGRDTKSDKLGPFRLDLGPHIFRGLAARLLPTGIRR
jgi:hypothetical protein